MDLNSIIESGGHVKLEVSPCDLMHFAEVLIEKAQAMKEKEMNSRLDEDEQFLSSDEVCQMFNICSTTLWSWHKTGYLRHRKFGKRNMYAMSDIRRIMNERAEDESVTGYCRMKRNADSAIDKQPKPYGV